jgi:catechol 2,3-dioxygenase-like lactoylglutathione lyase family enzyme
MDAPLLDGIHHVKIPVTDLARSRDWYASRLGYRVEVEFEEGGRLMGLAMAHPRGGPRLALRLDPGRSAGFGDFDFFSIGVPTRSAIDDLARRLSELGEEHAGVHFATIGWVLPMLHDPDGHEVRFYTTEHHTEPDADDVVHVVDPRESAEQRERLLDGGEPRG